MKKIFTLILLFLAISFQAQSQQSLSQVYAVFMYTFTKHIDNPVKTGDYKISIVGDSKLYQELQKFHGAKTPTGQLISIVDANNIADAANSRMVFLASGKSSKLDEIKSLSNATLIITERNGMIENGSCINFINRGNKVSFEISEEACSAQNIKVSSKLFALSK